MNGVYGFIGDVASPIMIRDVILPVEGKKTHSLSSYWTLVSRGGGTGVSRLKIYSLVDQTITITSGNAKFYTDSGGTLGESTTWDIVAGATRTMYIKSISGDSIIEVPRPDQFYEWGKYGMSQEGWVGQGVNYPSLNLDLSTYTSLTKYYNNGIGEVTGIPPNINEFHLMGYTVWTYMGGIPSSATQVSLSDSGCTMEASITGSLPTGLLYFRLGSTNPKSGINWTSSENLPDGIFNLYINSPSVDWTGLSVGNLGNITDFRLLNYRSSKMSSADMLTLLTQLTNRTGTLPSTITINDYVDYASPPSAVTDAVAALKIAKSITTVNLGE